METRRDGQQPAAGLDTTETQQIGQATTFKQGKYQGKPDTRPYDGGPGTYSFGSQWNAGDKASEFVKGHARAEKEVYFREFTEAGFRRRPSTGLPELKENFVAVFEKVGP